MILYHYFDPASQKAVGPFSIPALAEMRASGFLNDETLVATAGEQTWTPLRKVIDASKNSSRPDSGAPSADVPRKSPSQSQKSCAKLAAWSVATVLVGLILTAIIGAPAGILCFVAGIACAIFALRPSGHSARTVAIAVISICANALLSFVVLTGAVGRHIPAVRITVILEQCQEIGQESTEYRNLPGQQANFIADRMQRIDVSDCPPDFRMAFNAHIMAWRFAAPALANDNFGVAFVEGFIGQLTEDPSQFGRASAEASQARQEINRTYFELTQIAAKYGAKIPRSVVD